MSKKISVRLPDSLHRQLTYEALEKNQSFTTVVVKRLKGEEVERRAKAVVKKSAIKTKDRNKGAGR